MKPIRVLKLLSLLLTLWVPVAAAGTSCSVDNITKSCEFTCTPGDAITVSGHSSSDAFDATISGACGGESAGCTAPREKRCEAKSPRVSSGGTGTCQLSGSGTGSCAASGGEEPKCINLVLACIPCPPAVCVGPDDGGGTPSSPDPCAVRFTVETTDRPAVELRGPTTGMVMPKTPAPCPD